MVEGFCFTAVFSVFFFTWSQSACFHLCFFFCFPLFVCDKQERNSKQANTHASKQQKQRRTTAQEQNTDVKHAECDHVKKAAKQNSLSI
jgi:hypothetical protein